MSKQATKALESRYCQARLAAAEYNSDFCTRRLAIEHLPGVSEDCLKKYELGITTPPNVVVAFMSDAYNDPALRNWYCSNECPLGKGYVNEINNRDLADAAIRIVNITNDFITASNEFAKIVDDGVIDDFEFQQLPGLIAKYREAEKRVEEVLAAIESHTKNRK